MANENVQRIDSTCCVVGGGPAGVMLGFLLARQGVKVTVLEKHKDFFRDFRGDTIHPSTLDVMHELGLLEDFLKNPHQQVEGLTITFGNETIPFADFSHLPTRCKFLAFMPQWDFLNFLAEAGKKYSGFDLRMETAAYDLIERDGRIVGVKAKSPSGDLEIHSDLVVAADGRASTIRERSGLKAIDFGVPIDVVWLKIPKDPGLGERSLGYLNAGKMLVLIDRGEYFQCGYIIKKGEFENIKARGIESFQKELTNVVPFLQSKISAVNDFNEMGLLTVKIDRLERWHRPGLLCIGDSAHAMSPAGGVGVNLAVQDAVATANILGPKLLSHSVTESDLQKLQDRRLAPTKLYQRIQRLIHTRLIPAALSIQQQKLPSLPLPLRLLKRFPLLRRLPARLVGLGLRPEHVRKDGQ